MYGTNFSKNNVSEVMVVIGMNFSKKETFNVMAVQKMNFMNGRTRVFLLLTEDWVWCECLKLFTIYWCARVNLWRHSSNFYCNFSE